MHTPNPATAAVAGAAVAAPTPDLQDLLSYAYDCVDRAQCELDGAACDAGWMWLMHLTDADRAAYAGGRAEHSEAMRLEREHAVATAGMRLRAAEAGDAQALAELRALYTEDQRQRAAMRYT